MIFFQKRSAGRPATVYSYEAVFQGGKDVTLSHLPPAPPESEPSPKVGGPKMASELKARGPEMPEVEED